MSVADCCFVLNKPSKPEYSLLIDTLIDFDFLGISPDLLEQA